MWPTSLEAAEAQDAAITEQIASDEDRVEELQSLVAAIARESYKGGSAEESLGIVFGAADEDEFVDEFTAQQSASRVQASTLAELDEIAAVNRNRGARQEAVRDYITEPQEAGRCARGRAQGQGGRGAGRQGRLGCEGGGGRGREAVPRVAARHLPRSAGRERAPASGHPGQGRGPVRGQEGCRGR
ncbi:hypothetical protein [Demequina litorisediminis]|uniref:hypothetical protein n=1 Tax=Demequina litorisediminis TaxID=1849022 RepID=UPI0024E17634|nr:hypothetical protein [Demequina litorisediminis]